MINHGNKASKKEGGRNEGGGGSLYKKGVKNTLEIKK